MKDCPDFHSFDPLTALCQIHNESETEKQEVCPLDGCSFFAVIFSLTKSSSEIPIGSSPFLALSRTSLFLFLSRMLRSR